MAVLDNRIARALRRPANWIQLVKFGTVGASGYVVNLSVYTLLLEIGPQWIGPHVAALVSFVVSAANNYWWNRHWTFKGTKGHFAYQGMRFFVVSSLALGVNQLFLTAFLWAGLGEVESQAIAILLVMPVNFVGNKLWSFRR